MSKQAFVESSKLKRHQLVHTGEKPFQVNPLKIALTKCIQYFFFSVPLKAVGKDFHWTLTFAPTYEFTRAIDPMCVHLMDVTKDLPNPLT